MISQYLKAGTIADIKLGVQNIETTLGELEVRNEEPKATCPMPRIHNLKHNMRTSAVVTSPCALNESWRLVSSCGDARARNTNPL